MLLSKWSSCSEMRPEKAAEWTEVNLLFPRYAVLREERLAREGNEPARELFLRSRVVS